MNPAKRLQTLRLHPQLNKHYSTQFVFVWLARSFCSRFSNNTRLSLAERTMENRNAQSCYAGERSTLIADLSALWKQIEFLEKEVRRAKRPQGAKLRPSSRGTAGKPSAAEGGSLPLNNPRLTTQQWKNETQLRHAHEKMSRMSSNNRNSSSSIITANRCQKSQLGELQATIIQRDNQILDLSRQISFNNNDNKRLNQALHSKNVSQGSGRL